MQERPGTSRSDACPWLGMDADRLSDLEPLSASALLRCRAPFQVWLARSQPAFSSPPPFGISFQRGRDANTWHGSLRSPTSPTAARSRRASRIEHRFDIGWRCPAGLRASTADKKAPRRGRMQDIVLAASSKLTRTDTARRACPARRMGGFGLAAQIARISARPPRFSKGIFCAPSTARSCRRVQNLQPRESRG